MGWKQACFICIRMQYLTGWGIYMFEHYRLPGGSQEEAETMIGVQGYCDLWIPESQEKRLPLVCFFDGALSEEDSKAREAELIHLPFYKQMAEEIYQSAATPFSFAYIPSSDAMFEMDGKISQLLRVIRAFIEEKRKTIDGLHLVGYSRGARLSFQNLIKGNFDCEGVVSFSSFSGAYMFNPKLLKKTEVQNILKPLAISIGSGRDCPFFLANYSFHRTLTDLGILHDYYLYKDHYMRSFYPILVRSVSWRLLEHKKR